MTTTTVLPDQPLDELPGADRLLDPALHAEGDPHAVWRRMREHAPVHRHEPGEMPAFWSLTRYEDVRTVYRDPAAFSSRHGVLLRPAALGEDPGGGLTLALTDPPRHKQLRSLMADWFHTRAVRGLEDPIRATTRTVLSRALELGSCDIVHDIAGRLSLYVISGILGVPEEDREALYRWTDEAFEAHVSLAAHPRIVEYFMELLYRRMEEPRDDLVSSLVHGTVNGELLTEEELLLNCENLIGATENGRLALIGGVLAFLEHPGQWRRLHEDRSLLPGAVEEVLRWTSSATHSMRTATRPYEIRGRRVEPGDRVVLWLPSANRDEDVFADPYTFDIARRPNRHIALAAGEHYCIGSTLARTELRLLFTELLDSVAAMELDGPVTRLRSIAVNGPASLPVRLTAR
ncbi:MULTISPECIES: cytochrome P450 [Streptomyces]|uniref:Cytochrome P450 n=1 Tax=Streptomyces lycii TaxID=2654337 RepID=A0ABQ7FLW2_9ACTN|nr:MULTISPECIES: cytochrome P450 [Streptomyces]KAF4408202.1 cytochrome P450 [Streptomyces lycii]PGH46884.1 cytochrome [Streptomyces sp. Ru87]